MVASLKDRTNPGASLEQTGYIKLFVRLLHFGKPNFRAVR